MKKTSLLILVAVMLTGCVASTSVADKRRDGTTEAACLDACADKTQNRAACAEYMKDVRASCAELIQKVCSASKEGCK